MFFPHATMFPSPVESRSSLEVTAVSMGPQLCSCEAQQCIRQCRVHPVLPGNSPNLWQMPRFHPCQHQEIWGTHLCLVWKSQAGTDCHLSLDKPAGVDAFSTTEWSCHSAVTHLTKLRKWGCDKHNRWPLACSTTRCTSQYGRPLNIQQPVRVRKGQRVE